MKFLYTLLLLVVLKPSLHADEVIRERIEWTEIRITDADKTDLPRVLFVGDSILGGYFDAVEFGLSGKAYCARISTSKCVSDPTFSADILALLKQYKFDVIHFNNGLHGWGYSEEQYRKGLHETISMIQAQANGAQLIWATTTPLRDPAHLENLAERTERVRIRNELAAKIMAERGISTNDLYDLVKDHAEWQSRDGVHFNAAGSKALADRVIESVLPHLESKR